MQADLCASPRRGVDGEVTLIGSANMDRRSSDLNYENNILWAGETAQARGHVDDSSSQRAARL
jgi:phosphatidylserine/phosphatidylglycerophosphate/cardiolipin synthase-like enzyme